MLLTIIILGYLLSVVIGYFGNRFTLLANNFDGDIVYFITIFIPFINIIWGILGFMNYFTEKSSSTSFYNKFFRIK